jgi:hypothetical protein
VYTLDAEAACLHELSSLSSCSSRRHRRRSWTTWHVVRAGWRDCRRCWEPRRPRCASSSLFYWVNLTVFFSHHRRFCHISLRSLASRDLRSSVPLSFFKEPFSISLFKLFYFRPTEISRISHRQINPRSFMTPLDRRRVRLRPPSLLPHPHFSTGTPLTALRRYSVCITRGNL